MAGLSWAPRPTWARRIPCTKVLKERDRCTCAAACADLKWRCTGRRACAQVREQPGQGANAGRWFCFDDSSVEPWDVGNLERDCFGGRQAAEYAFPDAAAGPLQVRIL
jgi:hypothetical protein